MGDFEEILRFCSQIVQFVLVTSCWIIIGMRALVSCMQCANWRGYEMWWGTGTRAMWWDNMSRWSAKLDVMQEWLSEVDENNPGRFHGVWTKNKCHDILRYLVGKFESRYDKERRVCPEWGTITPVCWSKEASYEKSLWLALPDGLSVCLCWGAVEIGGWKVGTWNDRGEMRRDEGSVCGVVRSRWVV